MACSTSSATTIIHPPKRAACAAPKRSTCAPSIQLPLPLDPFQEPTQIFSLHLLFFVLSLVVFFYFTLLRTAIREASPSRIEDRLTDRSRWDLFERRIQHEDEIVAAIDVLRAVAALILMLALLLHRPPVGAPSIPLALVFAAAVLVIARLAARALARARADTVLLTNFGVAFLCYRFISPALCLLRAVENALFRLAGPRIQPPEEKLEEELLEVVSEGQRTGAIEEDAREMIENIIDFRDLDVDGRHRG